MAEMRDPKEKSPEVTFWGMKLAEKDPELLQTHRYRILPGCVNRIPQSLLLILVSLIFFGLLVTILVQVAIPQKQIHSELEDIHQQLTWMNATLTGLCRPCPWNWEFFQGTCYFFSQTQGIWKMSIAACKEMGAQLVIINNTEEQTFLRFWNVRRNNRIWIGLSDHHNEGSWRWVDDSPLQLSFWMEGEPNNHGDEDCVELTNDGWNDNRCTAENFWTCEKPSSPCPGV
ncbi:CD209 antigen-like protein 2 isoform X2 [Tamandua tetradactyla]|uniref:CD209 antigen-like protein 2 isoform X2 n=1 Tax=Tamandua tetradactyla TaxID=48850 RepID=UPI004053BE4B